jgi:carboxyl-terminal processing protease
VAPTPRQLERVSYYEKMLATYKERTAYHSPVDYEGIRKRGSEQLLRAPDTDADYLKVMWAGFLAMPQGHQGMNLTRGCGTALAVTTTTVYDVCAEPTASGAIVTDIGTNALGLLAGDTIVAIDGKRGAAMFSELEAIPLCGTSAPSPEFRRYQAVKSMFASLSPGTKLTVTSPDGSERELVLPKPSHRARSCQGPFGKNTDVVAEASRLPDGTALVRIPNMYPVDDPSVAGDYIGRFVARIAAVYDTVKSAPRIIWDLRGNPGGYTLAGLSIVSGMPGARRGILTYCNSRVPKSDPPSFNSQRYAQYALTPGTTPFTFTGPTAVLIDSGNYSAADYFAYFVKNATSAVLIGSPTAGGYGAVSESFKIGTAPEISFAVDYNRCVAIDGTPLEGLAVTPQIAVEYNPSDLRAGKDTMIERALAELRK